MKTFAAEGDAIAARSPVVSRIDDIAAIECIESIKFKYGVDSLQGRIVAILSQNDKKYLAYVKRFPIFHPELYGYGCVAEVFNASDYPYLELEVHSPVRLLAPGGRFEFSEKNSIAELDVDGMILTLGSIKTRSNTDVVATMRAEEIKIDASFITDMIVADVILFLSLSQSRVMQRGSLREIGQQIDVTIITALMV